MENPRAAMGLPTMHRFTAVAGVAGIAFAAWLLGGWGGPATVQAVSDLGFLGFGSFAFACAVVAVRSSRGRQRTAWIWLMVGLGGWVVGDVIWALDELSRGVQVPFPSLADTGYRLFPVGACVALALFPIGHSRLSRIRLMLDGLILTGSMFVVSWVFVLSAVVDANGANRFAIAMSLVYPTADLVAITVAVLVLTRAVRGQRVTLTLLTAGIVLGALSDGAFVSLIAQDKYASGNPIDIGWAASLLLLGISALVGCREQPTDLATPQVPPRWSTWLPYVPLPLAAVVGTVYLLPSPGSGPVLVAALVVVIAVLVRQFTVVGENRRLLVTVTDQALHDPLTGLANRTLFHDRLAHAVQRQHRDSKPSAVLSLDMDDFKLVNDSLGHQAGDALLMQVAGRVLGCVRTADTVARLGGDEFAILIEGSADQAGVVGRRVLEAFDEPFVIAGRDLLMRPSIGLAMAPGGNPELSADALLRQADVAMYSAKRSRTGGVHTFNPGMHLSDVNGRELPQSLVGTTPPDRGGRFPDPVLEHRSRDSAIVSDPGSSRRAVIVSTPSVRRSPESRLS